MPDDAIVLGTTAYNDAARCPKRYEYRHELKLIPRPKDVRPVMRRGTWIHRCLQLHDLDRDWVEELERMSAWAQMQGLDWETEIRPLFTETENIVRDYIAFWQGRRGPEAGPFETIDTEVRYEYTPREGITLSATLDRLVRDSKDRIWIWERKSTGEMPDSDWRNIDPQTLLQLATARLGQGLNIAGIIFDYVLTDPGPSVRVYKPVKTGANAGRGGHLYNDVLGKAVSPRAFDTAVPDIYANWQDDPDFPQGAEAYVAHMRTRLVQPEAWFQRYIVLRPDEQMIETLKDAAVTVGDIRRARQTGHYARRVAMIDCRRFCPYMKLCFREYTLGRPSEALRDELFVVETPELRGEGRTEDAPISGRS